MSGNEAGFNCRVVAGKKGTGYLWITVYLRLTLLFMASYGSGWAGFMVYGL